MSTGLFRADLEMNRAVALIGQQIYGALAVRAGEPDPVPVDQASAEMSAFILHGLGR
jgi:hypothetical protein